MKQQLKKAKTIAIVGCSSKEYRTSFMIAGYLIDAGFRIIPVNPNEESVLGEKSYSTVKEIPEEVSIDIVNIFRNNDYTLEMVQDVVDVYTGKQDKPLIWTQLNVSSPGAKALAEQHGFDYVENRCIMVEHKRMDD